MKCCGERRLQRILKDHPVFFDKCRMVFLFPIVLPAVVFGLDCVKGSSTSSENNRLTQNKAYVKLLALYCGEC